jgi:hypothetical protein
MKLRRSGGFAVVVLSLATAPAFAKAKAPFDYFVTLRASEQQLASGHFADGVNTYIKALQTAEAGGVKCGEPNFVELIAVGDEVAVRAAKLAEKSSPADVITNNKLTESALKTREHTAASICGADSAAVVAAWQGEFLYYNMTKNKAAADLLRTKLKTSASVSKFDSVLPYRNAGSARASAFLSSEINSSAKSFKAPKKSAQ